MVNILLDTNILHQEGLKSTRFQVLQRLIKNDFVNLYIPEIVIEEYKSKKIDQANEDLKKLQSSIDSLNRKGILDKEHFIINQFYNHVLSSIEKCNIVIDSWLVENNVYVYPISNTSIVDIFKCYFAGTGAFRKKKQREDIPDAVIHDCIIRLSQDEELSVIAKDNTLLEAISKIDNVKIYKTLSDLLEIPVLKKALTDLNAGEKRVESIINALNHYECRYNIDDYLNENNMVDVKGIYGNDFIELPYELTNIKTQNSLVEINDYEAISVTAPIYLGNGRFSYTLTVECVAKLSFLCDEEDFESLSYSYRKAFSKKEIEDQSEVLVSGEAQIEFLGVLILSGIDENTDSNALKIHLSYIGAERSEIELEINMERIEISDVF